MSHQSVREGKNLDKSQITNILPDTLRLTAANSLADPRIFLLLSSKFSQSLLN